jgi:hypothetical protein
VAFRLPDGQRQQRRFRKSDPIGVRDLYSLRPFMASVLPPEIDVACLILSLLRYLLWKMNLLWPVRFSPGLFPCCYSAFSVLPGLR